AYEYRRVSSSTSTLIAVYPSKSVVDAARVDASSAKLAGLVGLQFSTDATGNVPVLVSKSQILLGVDSAQRLIADIGLQLFEAYGPSEVVYQGEGSVSPFFMSQNGKVLLGFDKTADALVGAFPLN